MLLKIVFFFFGTMLEEFGPLPVLWFSVHGKPQQKKKKKKAQHWFLCFAVETLKKELFHHTAGRHIITVVSVNKEAVTLLNIVFSQCSFISIVETETKISLTCLHCWHLYQTLLSFEKGKKKGRTWTCHAAAVVATLPSFPGLVV